VDIGTLLVNSLAALAAIISAVYAARQHHLDLNRWVERAQKRLQNPLKIGGKQVTKLISGANIRRYDLRLRKQIVEFSKVILSERQSTARITRASRDGTLMILSILAEIRDANDGELPTQRLRTIWQILSS
jgi:hypothetical protein